MGELVLKLCHTHATKNSSSLRKLTITVCFPFFLINSIISCNFLLKSLFTNNNLQLLI